MERDEPLPENEALRRLHAHYATARALAESATLKEATPRILQALCESLDWEHGAFWGVDRTASVLRCLETWHPVQVAFPEFDSISRNTSFAPGIGLPGRVWESGRPAWIPDVVTDKNFPRAPIADREGLHGAFGFPILLNGEVLGILEFFLVASWFFRLRRRAAVAPRSQAARPAGALHHSPPACGR